MGNSKSNYTAQNNEEYVTVKTYNGETKNRKRHGRGVYLYPNGDMYDGEWRKSRKYGYGVYTFADGKRLEGFFYKDEYIGKKPNEKMKRRMERKEKCQDKPEINYSVTEQTDISNDLILEDNQTPRLKSEGSSSRRNESFRRTKWLRDKYNIPSEQSGEQNKNGRDFLEHTQNMKRSYSRGGKNNQDEAKERRESKRLRESIRQKYKLNK